MSDPERLFVALGSNLDGPEHRVLAAMDRLHASFGPIGRSSLYRTAPIGFSEQPDFINAMVELRCDLAPGSLMQGLLEMEASLGRVRSAVRDGPRAIDLDLVAYGARALTVPGLELPHPRFAQRRFVLAPWAELAPEFSVLGRSVSAWLADCPPDAVARISDAV